MKLKRFSIFVSLLFVWLCVTGCVNEEKNVDLSYKNDFNVTIDKPSNRVSMITAGDALIHSSVYQDYTYKYQK